MLMPARGPFVENLASHDETEEVRKKREDEETVNAACRGSWWDMLGLLTSKLGCTVGWEGGEVFWRSVL